MTYTRTYWFGLAVAAVFIVMCLRLVDLQLLHGVRFREMADSNRFFTRHIPAARGVFLDRTGSVIVKNAPAYKHATQEAASLPYPKFEPISEKQALQALAQDDRNVVIDQQRTYPYGKALAPVLGYLGETTEQELQDHKEFYLGESVGKFGLEKLLQPRLAGRIGSETFEMNASGKLLRSIAKESAVAGKDVQLTIDAELSKKAYEVLADRKGAIVVTDVKTGEVLALVSSPSFDPDHVSDALVDDRAPMLNRAIAGLYPPGSTFKMITAIAGLEHGVVKPDTIVHDEGELKVGEFTFGNWYFRQYGRTEGDVDLIKALQRSNDIFFYKVAEWVGPESLARTARLFHLGKSTGIELSPEAIGVVPDPQWKQKALGAAWYLGDTYHTGIGQGDVLVTPLQLNQVTAAVANNGTWCKPKLLHETQVECEELVVGDDHIAKVQEGMRAACAVGGTAFPFFDKKPVEIGCKTGTAEFGSQDEHGHRKTHGWLTLFAPATDPAIAMTVMLEGTEETPFLEGSRDAGPVAKALLTAMVERDKNTATSSAGPVWFR